MEPRHSDMLYLTRLDESPAYIYVLVEHQSQPDWWMALRVLEYMVHVWQDHRKRCPEDKKLPPILPIVLHSGSSATRWGHPTELSELLDGTPGTLKLLDPFLPHYRFLLDDVAAIDHSALRRRKLTVTVRLLLAVQKIGPSNRRLESIMLKYGLVDDLGAVLEVPDGLEKFDAFAHYLYDEREDPTKLAFITNRLTRKARTQFMSIAEQLRAEGLSQGETLGLAKGRTEGVAQALTTLLTHKFGPLPAGAHYAIQTADQTQLETWTLRVLNAQTLDEVFQ